MIAHQFCLSIVFFSFASVAYAQPFELSAFSVQSSGVSADPKEEYAVSLSFSEAIASDEFVAGPFDISIGFWHAVGVAQLCPADFTGDGQLNYFDVNAFLNAYNAQDPSADLNMDGSYDYFDVNEFLLAYKAGC